MDLKQLGLNLGLDEDEYRKLIELFMTSGAADFEELALGIDAGDVEKVRRRAHAIKGASGNLGLLDIFETAGVLEAGATSKQMDDLSQAVATMRSQFDAIEQFLRRAAGISRS